MTNEEKQLLLKDLCARLQYKVVLRVNNRVIDRLVSILNYKNTSDWFVNGFNIDFLDIKPYLRPMSSMTEKEKETYESFVKYGEYDTGSLNGHYEYNYVEIDKINDFINWLNTHHFDYHRLIEKGLAIEAPDDMYNK